MAFKSGFVTIIGRSNVGKSTLLNKVIGEKVSIVSDKAQTTRNKIQLIYTDDKGQIIFLDTPGVQTPKNELGEYMLEESTSSLTDVDLVLFMVEAGEEFGRLDSFIFEKIRDLDCPKILLINKKDLVQRDVLEKNIESYTSLNIFERVIPISALEDDSFDQIIEAIMDNLDEGPMYYPADMITDQPVRLITAEIIREKILRHMSDEIPHGVAVEVLSMEKRDDKDLIDVRANIYVEKKSHKPMLIGRGGRMLKKIGSEARKDIEKLTGNKVNLKLWVKISKNWRKKQEQVKGFGYK